MTNKRLNWAAAGDVNAFFGLMLDNVADLLLTVGLLSAVFQFPVEFSLRYMVPGTAIGVLVGDLAFFWLALRLARRTGRDDVTAMPLGLDTPSTFGMVFFVLGPAFLQAKTTLSVAEAALHTWHIGICAIFISGLFKLAAAFFSGWIRRIVPRAGLLGSLAAIALVLISFLPLVEVFHYPVVGLTALGIILTTLVARVRAPFHVPGALAALLVAGALFYVMKWAGFLHPPIELIDPADGLVPTEWWIVFRGDWLSAMGDTVPYLPIVIPFALGTVVGGIDCTESAAAAGDEFDTRSVIAVEAVATIVASLCGGVIQSTPYIGHPAYKAMGGRSAYTLATALFVGAVGVLGVFGYLYLIIPKATVFPILVFIGLEITAQSFHATPVRHYAAVSLACVPALASLVILFVDKVFGGLAGISYADAEGQFQQVSAASLPESLQTELFVVRLLASGFIVTSLLWAASLVHLIDRQLKLAAAFFGVTAACALFGIIHSPLPGSAMFLPWDLPPELREWTVRFVVGYLLVALLLLAWDRLLGSELRGWYPLASDGDEARGSDDHHRTSETRPARTRKPS